MRPTTITRRARLALCLAPVFAVLAVLVPAPTASAVATVSSARSVTTVAVPGCSGFSGARALGSYYSDAYVRVYACGARPSWDGAKTGGGPVVRPFAGSNIYYRGYQCIELVARYLKARYGALPGVANGAQAVDRYAAAYPSKFTKIANGTKAKAPRKGDVLSLSANKHFNDVGHTGIVISSTVNSAGNGTLRALEQNWGGAGGTSGYHTYTVKSWRVVYAGLPYIKWLRTR
jgi:CHAP domain